MAKSKLTAKQRLFIEHYLDCLNATEAARRAGYKDPQQAGYENKRKQEIAAEISAGLAERAMPANEVLARLAAQARADIRELYMFDEDGKMSGLRLTRDAPLHLIKSITPTRHGLKIEVHDQQTALQLLGKHHGLFVERHELSWRDTLKQQGHDPDAIKQQLIAAAVAALQGGTGDPDPGSA